MARNKSSKPAVVVSSNVAPRTPAQILSEARKAIIRDWRKTLTSRRYVAMDTISRTKEVQQRRTWSYETERLVDQAIKLDYYNNVVQIKRVIYRDMLKAQTVEELVAVWDRNVDYFTDKILEAIPHGGWNRSSSPASNVCNDNKLSAYRDIIGKYSDVGMVAAWAKADYAGYLKWSAQYEGGAL